jgi:hypothetical protein
MESTSYLECLRSDLIMTPGSSKNLLNINSGHLKELEFCGSANILTVLHSLILLQVSDTTG